MENVRQLWGNEAPVILLGISGTVVGPLEMSTNFNGHLTLALVCKDHKRVFNLDLVTRWSAATQPRRLSTLPAQRRTAKMGQPTHLTLRSSQTLSGTLGVWRSQWLDFYRPPGKLLLRQKVTVPAPRTKRNCGPCKAEFVFGQVDQLVVYNVAQDGTRDRYCGAGVEKQALQSGSAQAGGARPA
jgi:hypothetical protein